MKAGAFKVAVFRQPEVVAQPESRFGYKPVLALIALLGLAAGVMALFFFTGSTSQPQQHTDQLVVPLKQDGNSVLEAASPLEVIRTYLEAIRTYASNNTVVVVSVLAVLVLLSVVAACAYFCVYLPRQQQQAIELEEDLEDSEDVAKKANSASWDLRDVAVGIGALLVVLGGSYSAYQKYKKPYIPPPPTDDPPPPPPPTDNPPPPPGT